MHVFKSSPAPRKPTRHPKAGTSSARSATAGGVSKYSSESLNGETSAILAALIALKRGNADVRLPEEWPGQAGRIAEAFNEVVELNVRTARELERLNQVVGREGKLRHRASLRNVSGFWSDSIMNINALIDDLVHPTTEVARVIGAFAQGDLTKTMALEIEDRALQGEFLRTAKTINKMIEQLSSFATEVTRVAREVGTEGILGGQARVEGVSGTWKDLTDNVNLMASNLTSQVRGIAKVVTAVAMGDLKLKLKVDAKGEIAELAETINSMTDTLATFAEQVTSVAREVGVEGKLGGQAKVPGASGTWKGLTENVNQLAANLTTQVRAIAEVATAVTQGDLTRSIAVQAEGEVAALKDTINEMIRNLKDTTHKNTEQDWRKTNLAKFSRLLQGQKDLVAVSQTILSELAPVVGAQQAEFYVLYGSGPASTLRLLASYASGGQEAHGKELSLGEGLVGQCAVDKQKILMHGVPVEAIRTPSETIRISSGLSVCAPRDILVLPIVFEGQVKGVLELASLERFSTTHQVFLDQLTESIGVVINTMEANMRTENLLQQSQSLAQELQQTNLELQEKAQLLAHQNHEVERKNSEVEQARQALEEKAKQLALTSKYKSEFLANMSHELRTPLNSLLILSDQLSRNKDGNLTSRQVEFARTIHSAGNDLLMLINDILDLSKIESGTVVVDVGEIHFDELQQYVERNFRHVAEAKSVGFLVRLGEHLPKSVITDAKRLQQILKNLLSNAFKFTHRGQVTLTIDRVERGWSLENEELERAHEVLAFSVADSGIGISADKQQIIFEAFQQADGSTSRKYGGTGLGLAISRELAKLLGGEIRLVSSAGTGSIFTLYIPQTYIGSRSTRPRSAAEIALQRTPDLDLQQILLGGDAFLTHDTATPLEEPGQEPLVLNEAHDDRDSIQPTDRVLLIVENDLPFAHLLLEGAREKGFKGLVTTMACGALALTRDFEPDAVTLDLHLPDMNGWRVLDRLKNHLTTRHIPVCVISTDESRARALESGAAGFIAKPLRSKQLLDEALDELYRFVTRPQRHLLILMADSPEREEIVSLLSGNDVRIFPVGNSVLAVNILRDRPIDCLVIGPGAPVLDPQACAPLLSDSGTGLRQPAVIFYGPDRSAAGYAEFRRRFKDRLTLREALSSERLLEQTTFFLHRNPEALGEAARRQLETLHDSRRVLANRKVLIVDDDMRNIFALATVLDEQGMIVISADNGREAIQHVRQDAAIDVVLMDIMMPEMDGIATIQAIRKIPERHELPIIAVTAKAMKGDREKCIGAGAWDYLSKPVNTQDLLAALHAWLKD
ncbi:MAG TPA: response regulator [Steroidobacteraceae bacterium]|nr:response regulator [Steroidobacteraceae bacterium]